jgi:hypothetical protein
MKRLNPSTGLPFKRGDMREDDFVFCNYLPSQIKKNGYFKEKWNSPNAFMRGKAQIKQWQDTKMSTKIGHIKNTLSGIKSKAKSNNISFNLTLEHLISIAPDFCPVFNIPLGWCERNGGVSKHNSPSLDKIIPELGYTIGNVQWLSKRANGMKQDATPTQLKQFAEWIFNRPFHPPTCQD